jgi:hypothetical protein
VGHSKGHAEGKFKAVSAYIKKTETSQINNLWCTLSSYKNKNKPTPKQAEGEK